MRNGPEPGECFYLRRRCVDCSGKEIQTGTGYPLMLARSIPDEKTTGCEQLRIGCVARPNAELEEQTSTRNAAEAPSPRHGTAA